MNSFYLTLPSDSSMDIYPTNTQCCFKVKLPQKIQLDKDQWEVAIVEMIVPAQFANIDENDSYFDIISNNSLFNEDVAAIPKKTFKIAKIKDTTPKFQLRFKIPPGSYMTPEYLCDTINDTIQEGLGEVLSKRKQALEIRYSNLSNRPKMLFQHIKQIGLRLSSKMNILLGGDPDQNNTIFPNTKNPFPYNPNINVGSNQLFIYSDIVEYSVVGHIQAPILRVVPFKTSNAHNNETGTQHIHQEYLNLHYIPIAKSEFETIHINIRGDTGKTIHFMGGKSIVKLHFRKHTN